MDKSIIYREYAMIVLYIALLLYATVKLIIKKRLLTHTNLESEKAKKVVNLIAIPIVYFGLIFALYCEYPMVLDIPAVRDESYCVENAISRSYSKSNPDSYEKRYVDMDIDGHIERMKLYSYGITEGREYKIVYLPHSKLGQVLVSGKYNIRWR